MRTPTKSLLALLICLFTFACNKIETQNQFANSPNSTPVLEISQEANGMWKVTGKTLFFRLYDNGIVEFEYPDDKKKVAGEIISKAEEINTLKQTQLSEEKFQEIISLLNSEDFQKIQDNGKIQFRFAS